MPGIENRLTISIRTLGCKLNQAESEGMARQIAELGFNVTYGNRADAFILNTCTVTHVADRKCRQLVRALRKYNPGALIVVTGCYAQRAAGELADCGADILINNLGKPDVPQILAANLGGICGRDAGIQRDSSPDRVRSFIKIQDGCRNFCSYCIVPLVRSNVYSVDPAEIIREIKGKVNEGYREVVLTGTEIGSYQAAGQDLKGLIGMILAQTGIARLHLSSLQPQEIEHDLLALWQDRRLCRHFHMALQSGSDTVLKRMRRRYNTAMFKKAVGEIHDIMPDASVTTDVMTGFPGESEDQFAESYRFCKEMEFAALHVFSYSKRPGTLAADMSGHVPEKEKRMRSLRMLELAAESADRFAQKFAGTARQVLWENEVRHSSGIYSGLTDNYIRVYAGSNAKLTNSLLLARLAGPARETGSRMLKASTKGNYGELWSEVIDENQSQGNAQFGAGGSGETG